MTIGIHWDLVQLDFTLATAAIAQLKARKRHIGPYLMGGVEHAMWWLLPLGSSHRLMGPPGVVRHPKGAELLAPPPGKYQGDRVWVLPGVPALTSAGELREAIDAALLQLAGRAAPCP
ncbi:hypothetical protein [Streptomyces sp. I05A-00742]|uniref:hypothetical protein n=1 Tax=Streptomyces sp. I05A-00742 TaxID=2732853 RepID=UPI0014892817|nr:hypothetical protein [Streptomyces sp. I05A-00742]